MFYTTGIAGTFVKLLAEKVRFSEVGAIPFMLKIAVIATWKVRLVNPILDIVSLHVRNLFRTYKHRMFRNLFSVCPAYRAVVH